MQCCRQEKSAQNLMGEAFPRVDLRQDARYTKTPGNGRIRTQTFLLKRSHGRTISSSE